MDLDYFIPQMFWQSCDGMMVIDERRQIIAANPAMEELTGRSAHELIGKSECGMLLSCQSMQGCPMWNHPKECPGLKAMCEFRSVHSAEYMIKDAHGAEKAVSASYTPIQLPDKPVWALVVMRDMTKRKRHEDWLSRHAITDPLTGLPNRAAFIKEFAKEIKRSRRNDRTFSIGMADLDGFKRYNDFNGHRAGDDLLKAVAQMLQTGRRETDMVARYGGDEFMFLLPETSGAGAMVLAEQMRQAVEKFPFAGPGKTSIVVPREPVTLSAGIAVFPEDGPAGWDLIGWADYRLYDAKHAGGNRVVGPPAGPEKEAS